MSAKRWDLRDPLVCDQFKYLNWDRPQDLIAVLDALPQLNALPPLHGLIDSERIAMAGHSAGSGGALTVGGAWRNFTGDVLDLSDPRRRPKAYLAFSPQQPGNDGFFDTDDDRPRHSCDRITRPVLLGTGDGDSTCNPLTEPGSCFGDLPSGRRIPFERLPQGDRRCCTCTMRAPFMASSGSTPRTASALLRRWLSSAATTPRRSWRPLRWPFSTRI